MHFRQHLEAFRRTCRPPATVAALSALAIVLCIVGLLNASQMETFESSEVALMIGATGMLVALVFIAQRNQQSAADLVQSLHTSPVGYALFDANDRIVTCNHVYRSFGTMAGAPIDETMFAPGTRYIEMLGGIVRKGVFAGVDPGDEQWIAERIALRRAPGRSVERQMTDGRWAKIEDHRTSVGGILCVITDITAIKHQQREAEGNSALLKTLLDNLVQGACFIDANMRIAAFNARYAELLDYPADRLAVGMPIDAIIRFRAERGDYGQVDVDSFVIDRVQKIREGTLTHALIKRHSGQVVDFSFSHVPDVGVIVTATDVTEQRRAEVARELTEIRFRTMANNAAVIMWMTDAKGQTTFYNQPLRTFCGDVIDSKKDDQWKTLIHPDDREAFEEVYRNAVLRQHAYTAEYRLKRTDGEYRWLSSTAVPRFGPNGEFIGYSGSAMDITEIKTQQQALKNHTNQLELLFESLNHGVCLFDQALRVVAFNGRYSEIFEFPSGLVEIGAPIERQIRFRAERGDYGLGDIDSLVAVRLAHNRQGIADTLTTELPSGRFIEFTRRSVPTIGVVTLIADVTEKHRAEEARRALDDRQRAVAENAPGMMWLTDASGRSTYYNAAWLNYRGLTLDEELGDHWMDGIHPDDRERIERTYRAAIEGQQAYSYEFRLRHADGTYRWIHSTALPRYDTSGAFAGLTGTSWDITSFKNQQAILESRSEQLELLVEHMPQGVCMFGPDWRVFAYNRRYVDLMGYPADLITIGTSLETTIRFRVARGDYGPGEPDTLVANRIAEFGNERVRRTDSLTINGRNIERHFEYLPNHGLIISVEDNTERVLAEAGRRLADERIRIMADNAPVMTWMSDETGAAIYGNRHLLDFIGLSMSEYFGRGGRELVHPEDRDRAVTTYNRALEERAAYSCEYRLRRADGEYRWTYSTAIPRFEADGTFVGYLGSSIDITERREAEEMLRTAKEAAESASRTKSEFLANMSHELRTPLNAILGFSEIMKEQLYGPLGNPSYRDYAGDIHDSGTHLLKLINDILDVSKAEAGKIELIEEVIDVPDIAEASVRLVKARAEAGRVSLTIRLADALPPILADERLTKQILLNLLSNAIKFTPANGHVVLEASIETDGTFMISVADTGIGIALSDIHKVMQPFGQVDSVLSRKHSGTGLGLPLTKSLVELHGGSFTLESTKGVGTRATVRLPAGRVITGDRNLSYAVAS